MVGAASALRLQDAGFRTVLIDPGDKRRGASFGNAGHLGAEQVMPWSTWPNLLSAVTHLYALGGPLDFRWRDVGRWGPWAMRFISASSASRVARGREALTSILADAVPAWVRLANDIGAPDMVLPHGHANVWMSARNADTGREVWSRTPTGNATYRDMTSAELARYADVLHKPPAAGIVFSGTGQVRDPQLLRDAILAAFVARGGEIIADSIAEIIETDSDVVTRFASNKTLEADAVLVAAGAWSKPLMRMVGVDPPLIGERGYSIQSKEHKWPEGLPTSVFEDHSVVLSRFTNGLRATSFLEYGDPNAPADPRKWRTLEGYVRGLGVAFSEPHDRWVGPRPTLPDYVPAIGRLTRSPRVFYAFGHQHLGITMSAITAEAVAALAQEKQTPFDLAPFRIERFS